jgi:peroxiredoxin
MALPEVGSPAPDFTLPSTAGGEVTLSSLRGKKVLIAFFPLAFTSTCTSELCAMTVDYDKFVEAGAVVLPISVDSIPTLKEYKTKEKLAVDLLSDFKREVAGTYGVLNQDRFFSNRAYFVVDAAGVIRWAFVEERNGDRRENSELLSRLAAA